VDGLICSAGLAAAGCFIWGVVVCEGEALCIVPGLGKVVYRFLGCATLPVLVLVTAVGRAVRRVCDY